MDSAREFYMMDTTVSRVWISRDDAGADAQENWLDSMVGRCRERGVRSAMKKSEQEIERKEDAAREIAPNAYAWDEITAEGRGDLFRHGTYLGRQVMDVDDFTAYFEECRGKRALHCYDVESACPIREHEEENGARTRSELTDKRLSEHREETEMVPAGKKTLTLMDRARELSAEWLKHDVPTVSAGERHRLPVSLIASFVVIAISLMMIVSGSVMVAGAKRDVSDLRTDVKSLSREAELMEDKLEANTDYLEIYRIATEEYGMIDGSMVSSVYLEGNDEITIENFDDEEDVRFGLSTLLSAIGIHIGGK